MKKLTVILLPFACLNMALLSSCNKNSKDGRIILSFGDLHATDVTDVDVGIIQDKTENKESFMLAISSNTCVCWEDFHPIIKSYVTDNHLYCAHITYNEFKDYAHDYNISVTSSTTTFVVFENGSAKIKIQSKADDKTLKDSKTFNKFMEGNVKLPKMYLINEEDIQSIKTSKKNAVIYYERSECGDCGYLLRGLNDYWKKDNNYDKKPLYVLDCQPWKKLSPEQYQEKKDEFGISANINTVYGANIGTDQGVFPYFSYIKDGEIASGAVAFNDVVEKIDNKYVVTDSYYTEERKQNIDYTDKVIKNMVIPEKDISDNKERFTWDKDKALKVYQPIIESFLNSKLPNTNF